LLVTPVIVLWAASGGWSRVRGRAAEALALLVALFAAAQVVFGSFEPSASARYPLQFLCFPLLLWPAFRFGPRETASAGVLLAAMAIRATLAGRGPFAGDSPNESLLLLQSFLAVTNVMSLAVAASVRRREQVEARVRGSNEELEQQVTERTAQLVATNAELARQISDRLRAEADLRSSESRLVEAQRIAHVGSWHWDLRTERLSWSEELLRIYGLAPDEFEGRYEGFVSRVHPADRARVEAVVREAAERGREFAVEHRIVRPGGEVRVLSARGTVLVDEAGRPYAMLGTGQDITERKVAESEREALVREQVARREAEASSRAKDEFLAVLSHELRNPLAPIRSAVELLRGRAAGDPELAFARDVIERQIGAMARLLDDLLDVNRLSRGRMELRVESVALATVVADAVETARPAVESGRHELALELPAEPVVLRGDPLRLAQVFTNLLNNAARHMDPGGRIRVRATRDEDHVTVSVLDTGRGIDPEMLPTLFGMFVQAPGGSPGGIGVGLAIAKGLVELHGGTIEARSQGHGKGSEFVVRLPVAAETAPPARDARPAPVPAPEASPVRRRILIADDHADNAELLARFLRSQGHEAHVARGGAEATLAAEALRPEVVLLDIGMPDVDGHEVCRRVRAQRWGRATLLIAQTGWGQPRDLERTRAAGFDHHLVKPIDLALLARLVAEGPRRDRPGGRPAEEAELELGGPG
jgi:PAS domain S-box-containing protein